MMNLVNRRQFLGTAAGIPALASLLQADTFPNFAPKAKRVIYLHQSGAPSQIDLFDYKPGLTKLHGTELPASVRMGQRITGMTSGQSTLPVAKSKFAFKQYGQSGAWLSELLPYTSKI